MVFYLAAAGFVSALVAVVAKLVPALVLGLTAARFAITGIYEYYGGTGWMHLAGWIGVALAAVAIYAVLALELEGLRHRTILPTLRDGSARTALSGDDWSSIGPAVHGAEIRSQL